MIKFIAIFLLLLIISNSAYSYDNEEVKALTKGLPKKVGDFIDRRVACNHWMGEYAYDKHRTHEINSALQNLRCNRLGIDEKKLLKKYNTRLDVIDSINKAKDLY